MNEPMSKQVSKQFSKSTVRYMSFSLKSKDNEHDLKSNQKETAIEFDLNLRTMNVI